MFFVESIVQDYSSKLGVKILSYKTLKNMGVTDNTLRVAFKQTCGNEIGLGYLKDLVRNMATNSDKYDVAVAYNSSDSIVGFIIVELGECYKYPDIYSLNLICSGAGSGSGGILVGLYLYNILMSPNIDVLHKFGILEVANAYMNLPALCLYSKFGFEYSPNNYGDECFDDYDNLPMMVNVSQTYYETDKLFNIVRGVDKGFPKPPICQLRGKLQEVVGAFLNVKRYIDFGLLENIIPNYMLSNGRVINYSFIFDTYGKHIDTKIQQMFNNNVDDIERLYGQIFSQSGGRLKKKKTRKIKRSV